jgi:hypothetical protein
VSTLEKSVCWAKKSMSTSLEPGGTGQTKVT